MVFDPLGVVSGLFQRDPQCEQELVDGLVTLFAFLRKPFPGCGQNNGSVGFILNQSIPFQTRYRPIRSDVTDPKMARDLGQSTCAVALNQVGDRLDVILSDFRRMILADTDMRTGWAGFLWHAFIPLGKT